VVQSKAASGSGAREAWRRRVADRGLGLLGVVCMGAGLALIAGFALGFLQGVQAQDRLSAQWRQLLTEKPPPLASNSVDPSLLKPVGGVDFAIRVPRLGYYAAVKEGIEQTILYSGPGHYPETAWPGQSGTIGVAAHNVYWIQFPTLGKGDEVDLETRYGTYRYAVTGSRIVNPSDRSVLVQTRGRRLTLTTCWPVWAGAFATKRFVIFAGQIDPSPPPPGAA